MCSKRKEFLLSLLCFFATGNVNIASGFQSLSSGNVALLRYPLRSRRHANTELRVIQEDRSPERNNNAVPINNDEKEKWKEKSTKTEVSSEDKETPSESRNDDNLQQAKKDESRSPQPATRRKKMGLMWCAEQYCKDAARERVMGEHNQIILDGPATGQVAYYWRPASPSEKLSSSARNDTKEECYRDEPPITEPSVLLLVKPNDKDLLKVASDAVQSLTSEYEIHVSLDSNLAAKFKYHHGVDNDRIHLFEPRAIEGFGGSHVDAKDKLMHDFSGVPEDYEQSFDLICTLGGDGLLMHASMLFQGPVPPVISIAGGSLGFLTQFSKEEVVDAVRIALGQLKEELKTNGSTNSYIPEYELDNVFPPNMPSYPYPPLKEKSQQASDNTNSPKFTFGLGDRVCLSIRMRLECRIYNREGVLRARFNVLNEVVIDRGSSPYLANLECFCDDHHLTTVQADGVIFAT